MSLHAVCAQAECISHQMLDLQWHFGVCTQMIVYSAI